MLNGVIGIHNLQGYSKSVAFNNIIFKFVSKIKDNLQGKRFVIGLELQTSAIINDILNEKFRKNIQSINPESEIDKGDILTAIKNANGFNPNIFVSQVTFETLVKFFIDKIKPHAKEAAESVANELIELFMSIDLDEMSGVPNLKYAFIEVLGKLVQRNLAPTLDFLEHFFEIEQGHINTRHPDFSVNPTETPTFENNSGESSRHCELSNESDKKILGLAKRERSEIELIRKMLCSYFNIVKKNTCDYVPKIVLTMLLYKTINYCETELVNNLLNEESMEKILKPSDDGKERVEFLEDEIKKIKEANKLFSAIM